jgi:hypothetical protein
MKKRSTRSALPTAMVIAMRSLAQPKSCLAAATVSTVPTISAPKITK